MLPLETPYPPMISMMQVFKIVFAEPKILCSVIVPKIFPVILTSIYVIMIEPWLLALTIFISLAAISISAYRGRKLPEQNEKLYFHMGAIYNHNAELIRNREAAYVLNGERVITVDTERCFLTGNYQLRNFRGNANSYAWYLREQGYPPALGR